MTFLSTSEGGKTNSVTSGYRPQFVYEGQDWVAHFVFPDTDRVKPGEAARAYLTLLSPKEHLGKISVGMPFTVREGTQTVAKGTVVNIIDLEKSAQNETNQAT